jgi:hypothetical protein
MKVKMTDPGQLEQLLDAQAYAEVMGAKMNELGMK